MTIQGRVALVLRSLGVPACIVAAIYVRIARLWWWWNVTRRVG